VDEDAPDAALSVIAMHTFLQPWLSARLRALMRKEFTQIRRDPRLALTLLVQPVITSMLLGFALNATVSYIRLGLLDDSQTQQSRALVSALTDSQSFRLTGAYVSAGGLDDALGRGDLDAGLVIRRDYARTLERGHATTVQFVLNAINANTAAIAQGYAESILQSYNRRLSADGVHAIFQPAGGAPVARGQMVLRPAFLFNPGLVASWFIVTGVFGLLMVLDTSIVASATMLKERETGTIEQLLMSPANTTEIIVAKIAPLFALMCGMILSVTGVLRFVFHVPFHGNVLVVWAGAALCVLSGIGIGTVIATFSRSAQQALLTAFFVNPALVTLSGVLTPIEAMPRWLQPLTIFNPITHFVTITRDVLLKGGGFVQVWPSFAGLIVLTIGLTSLSVWRFRNQLR
jgi:drug efflux transport system permease protein